MSAVIVCRWLANAALAVLLVSTLDASIPVLDGMSLVGLGCIFGMDFMRGRREGWS